MSDESYSFSTARVRLEEIVTQVRKKDTSLEKSLDLLEEGVRLANACTELIDRADWTVGGVGEPAEGVEGSDEATPVEPTDGDGESVATPEGSGADDAGEVANSTELDSGDVEIVDGAPSEADYAADDDAFGDAAEEAWADGTPEYRDDEA